MPFHTLNPALARFTDGRVMVYGTMGGEGQPQTQSALFTRYAMFGQGLQQAITAPRWLLGKTWGENSVTLKLENRFDPALVAALKAAGHDVEILPPSPAPWAMPAPSCSMRMACWKAPPIRAATAPRQDSEPFCLKFHRCGPALGNKVVASVV